MLKLKGIIPPMLTPLDQEKRVDEDSTRRLVNFMLRSGVDGLFILGTMGEGLALAAKERYRLTEIVRDEVRGRCPVLVGVSDTALEQTLDNVRASERLGADALVVLPPFFKLLSADDILEFYSKVAAAASLPLVIYSHPALTGNKIPLPVMKRLMAEPKFVGVKDSSGDFAYFSSLLALRDERKDFAVLEGDETALAPALLSGADGIVPGIGSLAARFFKRLSAASEAGDKRQALALQLELNRLRDGIYGPDVSDWLSGHKEALVYLGILAHPDTVYYQPLSAEKKARVHETVERWKNYLLGD